MGVVIEDDGMTEEEFKDKMLGLNKEFQMLNKETIKQEQLIVKNLNDLLDWVCTRNIVYQKLAKS